MLKRTALVMWLAAFALDPTESAAQEVIVDARVELLATLFRLGGRDEYRLTRVQRWATAVDSAFARYASHPAAAMATRLAGTHNVGFFVPMNLAVHLTPPPALALRSGASELPSLHRTWTAFPDSTTAFVRLIGEFGRDTDFEAFLVRQGALIDTTELRLRRLVASVDLEWLRQFWGNSPDARFILVAGLINGGASYGQSYCGPDGREFYAIVGVTETDTAGFPRFDEGMVNTIAHEFSHPFADPLIDSAGADLRAVAETLYGRVSAQMRRQYYGTWDSMMRETLVRAAVVRYLLRHEGPAAADAEIQAEAALGFEWLGGLTSLLEEYEASRDRYPDLGAFMPRIVRFLEQFAARPARHGPARAAR